MKVVFLVVLFFVIILLVRFLAYKLHQYLRAQEFRRRANAVVEAKKRAELNTELNGGEIIINKKSQEVSENSRVVVKGTLISPKQNLESKYIGSVYRKKNGRFGSKKELQDV